MPRKVLIYRDEGVGAFSLKALLRSLKKIQHELNFDIKLINHRELLEEPWDHDCALLIFPGGRDVPYHQALKGAGNTKIRQYVEEGGVYLGICAGGYYGSKKIIFEKGTHQEIEEDRELAFFQGIAEGCLYNHKPYSYEGHTSASAAEIETSEGLLHVYYNGGCTFKNYQTFKDLGVLATYVDFKPHSPAIIECKIKCGLAILSGVHFEVSASLCENEPELYDFLKSSEEKRGKLFESIISRALTHSSSR